MVEGVKVRVHPARTTQGTGRPAKRVAFCWLGCTILLNAFVLQVLAADQPPSSSEGLSYKNTVVESVPLSIHVVKIDRSGSRFSILSRHAGGGALGLSTLADQIKALDTTAGKAVAGINGGFFQRDQTYAGSPRGLQIVDGELLTGPSGSATLWIDLLGEPHLDTVSSQFRILWPDGSGTPFTLNGPRPEDGCTLYTPAIGPKTRTKGGREFLLEPEVANRWLPLRINRPVRARIHEIHEAGDSPVPPGSMVLSVGGGMLKKLPELKSGGLLEISTACTPALTGARTALSGGPILVHQGRKQAITTSQDAPYEQSSMLEQHPRSAIGWNKASYFLVEVDGRQKDLSLGMSLEELSDWLVKQGCEEALNLDGGGSSTLWYLGEVRNNPCDGYERTLANSLLVVRKDTPINGGKSPPPPATTPESK